MLNKSGIKSGTYAAPTQILANPELQFSVGCIVPATAGVADSSSGRKIASAGLPLVVDLGSLNKVCKVADATTSLANAVLLHDVDVTDGENNGTALIFGFVDMSKVSSDMVSKINTAFGASGASKKITFVKY
nr:MAG: head decoration protein D [Bacteriophage sp.]